MIPHARIKMGQEELDAIGETLEAGYVAMGPAVQRFEDKFARYLGVKYAVATSSCTAALHLSMLALGVGPGDEVITTPMSWIASANAIVYCGAKPVFVDICGETLNMNFDLVGEAISPRTKAILPVHLYGNPCDTYDLPARVEESIPVVADCAHAIEAEIDSATGSLNVAQWGTISCYSFWGTKNLSTGEGGMAVTNDEKLARRLKELRNFGLKGGGRRPDSQYEQVSLGFKYAMSDIQATVGLVQLKRLRERYKLRVQAAAIYDVLLSDIYGVKPVGRNPWGRHAYHLYAVLVSRDRDMIVSELRAKGIGAGIQYRAIHLEPYYQKTFGFHEGMFPVAEDAGRRVLTLPFWPEITEAEQTTVVNNLRELLCH